MTIEEEDSKDFIYQLLYKYTQKQVENAYHGMVANMKDYVPQINDASVKLAGKLTDHNAMLLSMMLVLVMDDTNGFTQYALRNAFPQSRLAYFRAWFGDFARKCIKVRLSDPCVPDPRIMVGAMRYEYKCRRDNGKVFREFFKEHVPRGGSRSVGT